MFKHAVKMMALVGAAAVIAGAAVPQYGSQSYRTLRGTIKIDGSSTVYPITEAVAEEFRKVAPGVRVTVGISGTGGGFKRFAVGDTAISDASRPIKAKEADQAAQNNIQFIEVPVAYDGLSIVVNKENYWAKEMTVGDVKKIFLADSALKKWSEVRDGWPDEDIKIFAPGTDSGTFDYFKEVVAGKTGAIRSDMSVSEDDNVLVRGVAGNPGGIGFFGSAYYFENTDKLNAVAIINPKSGKAVMPKPDTIESGEYAPFSRPLFIYVNAEQARQPNIKGFVEFYLDNAGKMAREVGYVQLPDYLYDRARNKFKTGHTGTHFLNDRGEKVEGALPQVYR